VLKIVILVSNVNPLQLKLEPSEEIHDCVHHGRLLELSTGLLLLFLLGFFNLLLELLIFLCFFLSSLFSLRFFSNFLILLEPLVHFEEVVQGIILIIAIQIMVKVLKSFIFKEKYLIFRNMRDVWPNDEKHVLYSDL
jgi:hypothetical protein